MFLSNAENGNFTNKNSFVYEKKRVLKTFQEYLEITKKTFLENSVPDLLFYFSCLNNEL